MLPDIPDENPTDLGTQAKRSLGQRVSMLFRLATLNQWWRYTRVGTLWMWALFSGGAVISGQEPLFETGSGQIANAINWVLSLLVIGVACLIVAAAGMLPIVVHSALDRR